MVMVYNLWACMGLKKLFKKSRKDGSINVLRQRERLWNKAVKAVTVVGNRYLPAVLEEDEVKKTCIPLFTGARHSTAYTGDFSC